VVSASASGVPTARHRAGQHQDVAHVGELHEDMVVDKHRGKFWNIGNPRKSW
jgi:hypothetical protein